MSKIWGGYRQAYCTVQLANMPLPRSVSSLTLCSAWENGRESCWILEEASSSVFRKDYFSELNRIDGQPVEFEWKIFPGFTAVGILNEIQQTMGKLQCEPENFKGRIIFMSMFNNMVWDAKGNVELCVNNSQTKRVCRKISSRSLVFPGAWIWKEVARNLRQQTRWILESNCGENACNLRRIRSSDIPLHQPLGERTILKQRRRKDNNSLQRKYGKYWVAPPDSHLRREPRGNLLHHVSWINKKFLHNLLSQNCKPMKSDGTIWEIVRRPEVIQTMLRSRLEISRSCTFLLCSPVTKRKKQIILYAEKHVASRSKRNSCKRMDPKQCTIWPSLGHKSLQQKRRYSIEVQVQSLFKDQNESWIRIVNGSDGIDKLVREAMPIQEEEKASEKPAAKARPILKPSSTSGWDFTPIEQRQWIDIEIQKSKNPHCFQVSKFTTRLLRHSQQVYREEDGGVHNDQVIDECKKVLGR